MFIQKKILNNTRVFRIGSPFPTNSVCNGPGNDGFTRDNKIPYFSTQKDDEKLRLEYTLADDDKVFGLGENMGGINKRGRIYRLYATDDPAHTDDKTTLYSSHPFIIIKGTTTFGLFIDFPGEMVFDVGYTERTKLTITITSADADLYFFHDSSIKEIIKEYLQVTGTPYIPPKWAFGFQQCRWSYPDRETVENLAETFRKEQIPCDTVYIDIDYMDNYKVFTIDEHKFPDFEEFTAGLKEKGFKLISIIDPGVRIEDGYSVYEEGIKDKHFCMDENNTPFTTAVWPGLVHFPDFLNRKTRKWWGDMYTRLLDMGIDGFWNDMNEPTTFFTPEAYKKMQKKIAESDPRQFKNCWDYFAVRDSVHNLLNNDEYYNSFFHRDDDGKKIPNKKIHNLYGYLMARAFTEVFTRQNPGKRYFLLSRSSCAGMHSMAAIWTGDNCSWWEHIRLNISMLINLNMCGFFYTGADIGGFGSNASSELTTRWMQLAVFSPLFRNHSALGTREQSPFSYDTKTTTIIRNALRLRYALMPYLYSEFMKAASELFPFIGHLALHFDDEFALEVEDQFMVGNSIMAAPIYQPNAQGRYVYLPENRWLFWKVEDTDCYDMKIFEPGHHYIDCPLDRIPVFIRENSLLVLTEPQNYIGEKSIEELVVIGFVTDRACFNYYDDDGTTTGYRDKRYSTLEISVKLENNTYHIDTVLKEDNQIPLGIKKLHIMIYDSEGNCYKETKKI